MTSITKDLLLSAKPTADIVDFDITESSIQGILKQMSETELQTAKTKSAERTRNALRVTEDLYTIHTKIKEVRDVIGYDSFNAVLELRQMATAAEHYYNKYKVLHQKEESIIIKGIEAEIVSRKK